MEKVRPAPPAWQDRESCMEQVAQMFAMRGKEKPLALVHTYGCQQNVADSEKIKGQLREMGFAFTEEEEQADLILLNTCAVRENAEFRVFGNVGSLKALKEKKALPADCRVRVHDGTGAYCGKNP